MSPKRPSFRAEPHPQKRVPLAALPDYMGQNPSWRIHEMLWVEPCGWHSMEVAEVLKVHQRLAALERNTWREILNPSMGRTQHHYMPVDEIPNKDVRRQLEAKRLDDTESLVSLRVGKKERVWGILEGSAMLVLWWDPEHLIYPMNIKDN